MSIRPDHWIRRMARDHGMIEPFAEDQVREGVISYGVSSYGYDMRVADEFKVFTNVYNVLVDPKHFDPRSFVDITADYCDIPPNSFALARSVERFTIPRNVLCIVMGKSTYARCFRGDTAVALLDGTTLTLEEMAERSFYGERFWGYTMTPDGRVTAALLEQPRYIGSDALLEVTLTSGAVIHCTPDHEFLLATGTMLAAHDLRPGMPLSSLHRTRRRGKQWVYQPGSHRYISTERLADQWHAHHALPHVAQAVTAWQPVRRVQPASHTHPHAHSPGADAPLARLRRANATGQNRSALFSVENLIAWLSGADTQRAHANPQVCTLQEPPLPVLPLQSDPHAAEFAHGVRSVVGDYVLPTELARAQRRTHGAQRIAAIRELAGDHDVYCLTVPETGNFALAAGVFTSNCGIIVNVTPLEPEWEGYVTIEVSNTTQLPARVYANEGIAQVMFFASDDPCERSYADKKGKYQQQVGITLPHIEGAQS